MSQLRAALTLVLFAVHADTSWGIQPTESSRSVAPIQVEFGLGNAWKLGQLCPLRIGLSESLKKDVKEFEIQTVDGDGVDAIYRMPAVDAICGADGSFWIPIRIGRQSADISVRVLGSSGLLHQQQFDAETAGRGLSSSQPLIVAIGSSMGVEEVSRRSADGRDSTFTTVTLRSPEALPLNWVDYSSCDLIILSCQDVALLAGITERQWTAIDKWIRRGGACIVSLGSQAELLSQLESFTALLPGTLQDIGQIRNPAALESLVPTGDQPLAGFPCSIIELHRGRKELTFTDVLAREVPWWVNYSQGHGTMRFIASDLGHESFENWKDRKLLWQRLIAPFLDRTMIESVEESHVGDSSYLGYSDLVGQLRATLDLFPQVKVVPFGQVAAMLVGILLLIGPVDYFISVKWLKRPDLSWYLAGAMLVAISAGLTWLYSAIRPSQVHINSVQVIDIDPSTGLVNGRLWSHVYSGEARKLDMEARSQVSESPIRLDWQGLPGHGLGGLLSQLNTDRGMPLYRVRMAPNGHTRFQGVGIPAAGTKCLYAAWTDTTTPIVVSDLREIPGVDQLEGELANPLEVDLLDPLLYYHNWYYGLNSRIPAGQSVRISFDTLPKDISRRLNGRRTVDGKESIVKWDPADRNSVDRLLELMMFHKAASGRNYTSLNHRYQPQMDHSNLLATNRAILIGRIERPWATLAVSSSEAQENDSSLEVQQELNRVWCRIAIPVRQNVGN